jgi:hypothetical protein
MFAATILFFPVYVKQSNDFQEMGRYRSDTAKQPRIVLQLFGLYQPSVRGTIFPPQTFGDQCLSPPLQNF